MPTVAISRAATAGPTTLALFITTPLRLIALARSRGGTSVAAKACLAGESATDTRPLATPTATSSPTLAAPKSAATHSAAASNPDANWVPISSMRRSNRSASTPPHGPSNSVGSDPAASTRPSAVADPVSCSTSQPSAVACRKVPLAEATWPRKYSRYGRDPNARNAPPPAGLSGRPLRRCGHQPGSTLRPARAGAASGITVNPSRSMPPRSGYPHGPSDHVLGTASDSPGRSCGSVTPSMQAYRAMSHPARDAPAW